MNKWSLYIVFPQNWNIFSSEVITKLEGIKSLATLLLMGDTSDNIKGIPGVGKVGANKILVKCSTVNGVKFAVARQYKFQHQKFQNTSQVKN